MKNQPQKRAFLVLTGSHCRAGAALRRRWRCCATPAAQDVGIPGTRGTSSTPRCGCRGKLARSGDMPLAVLFATALRTAAR